MFALLRTRRYPEGGVGSSRHIPGERPACWVPWLAQRPWRPRVRPKGPRAPYFISKGGINNNNKLMSHSQWMIVLSWDPPLSQPHPSHTPTAVTSYGGEDNRSTIPVLEHMHTGHTTR